AKKTAISSGGWSDLVPGSLVAHFWDLSAECAYGRALDVCSHGRFLAGCYDDNLAVGWISETESGVLRVDMPFWGLSCQRNCNPKQKLAR
ncbi:MAG TPA: hypothetical protein PLO53_04460, partial [Candidatus Hydrogenedentes bacterium]|nr:hypothetical protein [Candidatus Hydrogenedentota bacterium]